MTEAVWTTMKAVMDKPGVDIYHVPLTIHAHREDSQWASVCEELEVHSCGDTIDEAIHNAIEATLCYLNTIELLGERRSVFDAKDIRPELGWPKEDATKFTAEVSTGEVVHRMIAAADKPQLVG